MKRQPSSILTLFSAAIVLLVPLSALAQETRTTGVEIGKTVPDFALTDLTGKIHKLSDYRGKVVVLEWTNPNCPFVVRVYRDGIMTGVQKQAKDNGVVWLTINSTNPAHKDYETPEELAKIYSNWKAVYTAFLMDPEGKVGKMYDAKTTPHMYVIGKDGTLLYNGAIDDDPRGDKKEKQNYVRACLNEIAEGKPITTALTKPYGCTVKY